MLFFIAYYGLVNGAKTSLPREQNVVRFCHNWWWSEMVTFLKIRVTSWDLMAAMMCGSLRAGGGWGVVINNKREGCLTLRRAHKWWPPPPSLRLGGWGAGCSSEFSLAGQACHWSVNGLPWQITLHSCPPTVEIKLCPVSASFVFSSPLSLSLSLVPRPSPPFFPLPLAF